MQAFFANTLKLLFCSLCRLEQFTGIVVSFVPTINMMRYLSILFIAFVYSISSKAQTFESMLCQSWHTYKYIQADGLVIDPLPQYKNDKISFHKDHTVVSLEGTPKGMHTQNGVWSYTKATKMLKMEDKESYTTIEVKVIKLTSKELVYEYQPPGRQKTKFYLRPVK
jgi:hypothetical protein